MPKGKDTDAAQEDIGEIIAMLKIENLTTDELVLASLAFAYYNPKDQQEIAYLVGDMFAFDQA